MWDLRGEINPSQRALKQNQPPNVWRECGSIKDYTIVSSKSTNSVITTSLFNMKGYFLVCGGFFVCLVWGCCLGLFVHGVFCLFCVLWVFLFVFLFFNSKVKRKYLLSSSMTVSCPVETGLKGRTAGLERFLPTHGLKL